MLCPDGKIEIFDPDGLTKELAEMRFLQDRKAKIEMAIQRIIETGGQYLHELERTKYAHGKVEPRHNQQLAGLIFYLQNQNRDLRPEEILKLPEYLEKKKEFDAETECSAKVLAEIGPKIAIYNEAVEVLKV